MAAQTLSAYAAYTPLLGAVPTGNITTAVGSDLNFTFNAAGDKIGFVFQAWSTTPPDIVAFHCDTVTTAGTTGAMDCTLETVATNGTGAPTGTAVTNSGTASVTFSTTGVKTASGLQGTASLTVGTLYAIVLTAGSGWNRTLTVKIATGSSQGATAIPYHLTKDVAGSWTRTAGQNLGYSLGLADSGGAYQYFPGFGGAYSAAGYQAYADATNPDERGNRFSLPVPVTCVGAILEMVTGSAPGANDDFSVSLYSDHTGTPSQLTTVAIDGGSQGAATSTIILFPSPQNLTANTVYALAIRATGTDSINHVRWDFLANAHLGSFLGTGFYSTTRNNGSGAFTDTNTSVYGIFPLFSKLDDGVGGSGGGIRLAGAGGLAA